MEVFNINFGCFITIFLQWVDHVEGSGHKGSKPVFENFRENEVKDLQR